MVTFAVHGIGRPRRALDPGEDERWLTVEQFDSLLDVVAGAGAHLTFDDGNVSDVEIALPRLVDRGLHAEFFPLAGRVGERGYVGREDLRRLVRAGMHVGSHGWDRHGWRHLDRTFTVRRELDAAPRLLEELSGAPVQRYSLPSGSYDRRVLTHLREAGATRVYSTGGRSRPGAWLRPRVEVRSDLDAGWVENAVRRAGLRRWHRTSGGAGLLRFR
ncbi:polysaccharide deacetylase family protein [Amycolatopsis jiangsuensis]|uniref:Peptidoglycan/xylan/chitin deacetylase (PgdA/CDA1 family) n=1 Tax=Amycolatopsis jiangsuensis TaxID=1181879 RepID=A0A840IXF8_9PSEU|nr:polysaccharide deacetylase family protein [Amycolatopsis jiangsuensis]MBB4686540.1 peptidoglycan/xylan/chitin deacetylase (PgdA/CDA1 family) [Amycolatopsis jiangsuensis]